MIAAVQISEAIVAAALIIYLLTVLVFQWMNRHAYNTAQYNAKILSDLILRIEDERRIERKQVAAERQELLERIQRPEIPRVVAAEDHEPVPDPREMDLGLVGQVVSEMTGDNETTG